MYSGGSPIVDILASAIASTGLGREGNITRVNAQRRGGRKLALRQRKMKAEKTGRLMGLTYLYSGL
jgi:hypothetical protein